jgi:pimeloyl-ACP methyl ester carboxylesterase
MSFHEWRLSECFESSAGTVRHGVFGEGPPLVLVHGTPASSYVWAAVLPELERRWRVHVYDLPGYGSSEQRDGQDVSLALQTRVLAELLDHWALDRPRIAGHDVGGAITLRTHLLERRRFAAIALLDPVALRPWGSPFFRLVNEHAAVFEQLPAPMHAALVGAYLRGAFHRPLGDAELAPFVEPWTGPVGQAAFYRQIAQADERYTAELEPLYGEIDVPVLICWGEEDAWIPVETGRRLQESIPGSELRTIPEAGHFLQVDAPAAVAAELVRFFDR